MRINKSTDELIHIEDKYYIIEEYQSKWNRWCGLTHHYLSEYEFGEFSASGICWQETGIHGCYDLKYTKEYCNKLNDALKNGFQLYIFSSYRDYNKQYHLYYNVNNQNDEYVARPGFSEHQSGYALDISTLYHGLTNNFQYSDEYKWLIENSYKYGFILRYPEEKENITGYKYEPWHFRFVGEDIAEFLYKNKLTLEEYILKYLEIK